MGKKQLSPLRWNQLWNTKHKNKTNKLGGLRKQDNTHTHTGQPKTVREGMFVHLFVEWCRYLVRGLQNGVKG